MGCSMHTAVKEIEAAKERIISGDYAAARKKLLEIETHFPALDNISGMIAVCDILISAEFEFLGIGPDYFWILEVSPTTSERLVLAQFKRFSKLLEPIKSNFPGVASALKILEDAFAVLSNPEKRLEFSTKRARNLQSFGSGDFLAAVAVDFPQGYFGRANKDNTWLTSMKSVSEAPVGSKEKSREVDVLQRTAANDVLSNWHEETEGYCVQPIQAIGKPTAVEDRALEVEELPSHKWSATDFVPDQIWALYDGLDLMPRRYAGIVNNLVSGNEVCVTFLEPHPLFVAEVQWVQNYLPFVCGLFKPSKTTVNLSFSNFSHIVTHEQRNGDQSLLYSIVPKRGEVWAMYKGWSSRWTYNDFMNYRCHIVEIVSDLSEESGLIVACLQEVPGFTTFFQRQVCDGVESVRAIPREEMLSFSHQIPAYTVPGVETYGLPESSRHLDLSALPLSSRL